ncbi:MAG TPA: response regulator [Thermodesulfobacteriota bacterium]|nr:response regulator [Thermodesulfobacteriota bacterium]
MDILIVDDEPYIQRSLSFILRKEGFEVDVASNGEEGLEKAKTLRPKIIFLDVMMPRLNGFSTCRAIKSDESLKGCHVVMLTGKGQEVDKAQGLKEGANDFITKPFSPREIVAKVKAIFERSG